MTQSTGNKQKTYRILILRKHKVASSSVPVSVWQRPTVTTLPPSMRRLGAVPKRLPSCPRNLACSTPRAQTHSYARLPRVLWRGKGREWALGRPVTAPLTVTVFRKRVSGNGGGSTPYSQNHCIGDAGGQPGWPPAGPETEIYSRSAQLSPGKTGGGAVE